MVDLNDQRSPGCKRLRKELSGEGVDYVEVDVEESGEFDVMTQTLEIGGYLTTWVGYTRVKGVTLSPLKKPITKWLLAGPTTIAVQSLGAACATLRLAYYC